MARELSNQELEELLGAFALDAVDGDERDQVEEYLQRDPVARARVAQYREATALLAQPDAEAPLDLWRRIEDSLEDRQTAKGSAVVAIETRRSRSRRRMTAAAAAAAAAVLIAVLGVKVVQQDDRIDELAGRVDDSGGVLAAARNALSDPQAEQVALASPDGGLEARVVVLPDGEGYMLDNNLAELVPGRTYQLWALVGDRRTPRTISAGVLGPDPGVTAFNVSGPVVGFAITNEAAPGVASPESAPLLQGDVS